MESDQVVVFDWPALMMQRRSTLGLTYEGPSDVVNRTINAFNNLMGKYQGVCLFGLVLFSANFGLCAEFGNCY